ncbi:MAG: hypothetical protein OXE82_00945 [Rhodobacter sp.]|nr:hypothetical protein [Rhodobacter sp.]
MHSLPLIPVVPAPVRAHGASPPYIRSFRDAPIHPRIAVVAIPLVQSSAAVRN